MNPLNYAIACKQSYSDDTNRWIKGWFINGVDVKLTRIDGDYVLVLRGSMTARDWLRDLDAIPAFDAKLGWCHRGFLTGMWDIFNAVWNCTGGEPVSFTGHSLGGARARLLAAMFIVNKLPVKNLITFGAPKPAFPELGMIISNSGIEHHSYRNNEDIVPNLPETIAPIFNFSHTEQYLVVNGGVLEWDEDVKDHSIDLYIKGLTQGVQNDNSI